MVVSVPHTFVVLAYKQSPYLESCIQSVLRQTSRSQVLIATSTPNDFIDALADTYDVKVKVNPKQGKGIGCDFDFAWQCADSELVTIAHQDDIYDLFYGEKILQAYRKHPDSIILFSDYYEIRNDRKVKTNLNLKIKRLLLAPSRLDRLGHRTAIKRSSICFGNAICCPAVTFAKNNISLDSIFTCDMKCNIDWQGWEKLSREKGRFTFVPDQLMGHRIYEQSTTSAIIADNIRTQEDLQVYSKFWPAWIAKGITKIYRLSEKSNQL